jgi:hypothetical protein
VLLTALVTACGSIGNMSAVKEGLQHAVDCKPEEALKAFSKAQADGGISGYMGQLERIVVLQDAGRSSEAADALDNYMKLPEAEGQSRSEVEQSISESLEELRSLREEQTGKRTCS